MKPPFYRACRKHREELEDRTDGNLGHEILWCVRGGHRCRSWLVMDGDGEVLAVAFLNEAPQLLSIDLARLEFPVPLPPEKFCSRGHFEWSLETDGRYRCRICKRDRAFKNNDRQTPSRRKNDRTNLEKIEVKSRSGIRYKWVEKLNKKFRREQRCQRKTL